MNAALSKAHGLAFCKLLQSSMIADQQQKVDLQQFPIMRAELSNPWHKQCYL